jgi:hypothetical protein
MYRVPTVTAQVMGEERISNASIQGRKANQTERMVGGNNFVANVTAICCVDQGRTAHNFTKFARFRSKNR